jgi:uncharacterized membrane protein (UPF0182 family)
MSDQAPKGLKGGRYLLFLLVVVGGTLLLGRSIADFYTEILWFSSAGYASVFWTRFAAEGGMRLAAGAITVVLAYLNFRVVGRTLGEIRIKRQFGNLEIAERIPARIVSLAMGGIALLLGLWVGASFPRGGGLRLLLFLKAPEWGLETPVIGQDISFFVFGLPILGGILILGLALSFLLLSFSAAGYAAAGSLTFRGGKPTIAPLPRKHLALLGGIFLLLMAGRFWLSPYLLLLDGNSGVQGLFGFADANARIPGYRFLAFLTLGGAVMTWWAGFKNRLAPLIGGGLAMTLGGLLLVQLYPEVLQRWRVEPNELDRETPYIEAALEFTRIGFGLDDLQQTRFDYQAGAQPDWGAAAEQFSGLPIWTTPTLLTTFQEVEARFRYYDFENVVVDRYPSSQGTTPVAVAVREVDPGGIEDPNWQNLHLRPRFLAGMGAVASNATARTLQGRPAMFLTGIPPVWSEAEGTPSALALRDPAVVFGTRPQRYAILNPGEEAGAGGTEDPASLAQVASTVQGIRLRGFLRKVAFAWHFRDANLLFASEVSDESLLVFRRSVVERANSVAPFLRFLDAPYPVIHQGRIVWILEGFTTTRSFPISAVQDLPGGGIATYVRNSVKITVDAVTGEVLLYRVDQEDPLLEAWSRIFPDLLHPLDEMPEGLRSHIRYSRSLLELQARVLLQYHQETAPRFHGQQDVWALPQELAQGTRPVAYRPEYGLYRLPGESEAEFLLSTVFVPAGRQNLTGILAARSDPGHYGELHLLDIPVEEQVPGPRQIEALVEQDPIISQEFSLWRQGGSQVWSGHLHVIPVGETILYLEPIFLAAETDAIPELRRFVVSDGRRVAMEETLAEAISALARAAGDEASDVSTFLSPDEAAGDRGDWPQEALELLDEAERRLRDGDWTGFGEALNELRAFLRAYSSGAGEG